MMIIARMNPSRVALNGLAALDDLGVLRVTGADVFAFLNGQLTQQMATWAPGQARLAGYCSAKGRLLASFVAWRAGDDEVLLVCSADVAAATAKRLSMFVLRARCKVVDASAEYAVAGICGAPAATVHGSAPSTPPWHVHSHDGWVVTLPPAEGIERRLLLMARGAAAEELPRVDLAAWHWLEASAGVPRIMATTSEQFVPQMVNFEVVGGVDFQKGCYPGQEVVARSQYRGTIKRRMHLFDCDGEAQPGQEILHSENPAQPAGMVVNAGRLAGYPTRVLAEVKLAALETGSLHVGALAAPALRRIELPYPLTEPATT